MAMTIELWGGLPLFEWPGRWETYLVLALYSVAFLMLFVRAWRDFAALRKGKLLLFLALLFLTPLLNDTLILYPRTSNLFPPVYLPDLQAVGSVRPGLPVLGLLPLAAAAAWTGVGPAAVLGLVAGVVRAGVSTHNLLEAFNLAFCLAVMAYFLRQDYRGRVALLARQPFLALPVVAALVQPLVLLSAFAHVYQPGGVLTALDFSLSFVGVAAPLALLESLVHGFLLQLVYLLPRVRPVKVVRRPPPFARTLNLRLQFLITPLFILMVVAMLYAVGRTAVDIATQQAVDALVRDGTNGAEGVWQFISTGQSMIRQFAGEPELWGGDAADCQARLQSSLQMLPYFNRLIAYDPEGNVLCVYPPSPPEETQLTIEEEESFDVVLATGGIQTTRAHRGFGQRVMLSFLSPLEEMEGVTERHGVLVGRVEIDNVEMNPLLTQVLTSLQGTMDRGEGFVVDNNGYIVMHKNPSRLLEQWILDESQPPLKELLGGRGWARESRDSNTNARQMAVYLQVEGYSPWAVVILLPYEVVLSSATRIAAPLLLLLVALAFVVGVIVSLATSQVTRPLHLLTRAAERITEGNLEQSIHVAGDDELAQLGAAFEEMRLRLKDRLDDLSLLLRVAQEVSATLDVSQGMPRILDGALRATGAVVARIVLLSTTGEPQVVIGQGKAMKGVEVLDRALTMAVQEADGAVPIENLRRSRILTAVGPLPFALQSALALPVRSRGRTVAVMWAGFSEPGRLEPSQIGLLSTLASQTAVLIENAQLFQMAEGGRQRLAAILRSTSDAILVTDREDRMLLVNPAAEQILDMRADELVGKRVGELALEPSLSAVLTEPLDWGGSLVEEVPLPDGRTFYASASIIHSGAGENMGRVVVLRDITHFKELNEMKSEFVATVSHDLRAPLTFMRGYATMLPMVGKVNGKQQEYIDKILIGVDQMSILIEDLLSLGRIEAGVGLEEESCHIGAIVVEAVDGLRMRAATKDLVLRLEPSDPAPVIMGDKTLLRQAVTNLVDNALKYTPPGGTVTVGLKVTANEVLITVSDTGIGIAPEDQVRLFEKFYRIRRRETEGVQGSGLGLAIVKSIIERHGGRVWVDSTLNEGSVFTIALPLRTPPASERPSGKPSAQ